MSTPYHFNGPRWLVRVEMTNPEGRTRDMEFPEWDRTHAVRRLDTLLTVPRFLGWSDDALRFHIWDRGTRKAVRCSRQLNHILGTRCSVCHSDHGAWPGVRDA